MHEKSPSGIIISVSHFIIAQFKIKIRLSGNQDNKNHQDENGKSFGI
jgi:hypothetical protein